ncbi:MAG: hypothetical protein KTR17_04140 [Cellvibrionaceae bacterium]|nr:hypothetical protein [Cellvibrionaceae bacterium]
MLKAPSSSIFLAIILFSIQAIANPNQMSSSEALRIVEEYKILRNMCAKTKEEARKACFAELGEKNGVYSKAKKVLANSKNLEGAQMYTANQ